MININNNNIKRDTFSDIIHAGDHVERGDQFDDEFAVANAFVKQLCGTQRKRF